MNPNRLLCVLLLFVLAAAARGQEPNGRINSATPAVFRRGAATTLAVNMTNTGPSTEFLVEVTLPSGWSGGGQSGWVLVQNGQSRNYNFSVTPAGSLSGTMRVRLFGALNRNPSFPVLVDEFTATVASKDLPGEFIILSPRFDQIIPATTFSFSWNPATETNSYTVSVYADGGNGPGALLARFADVADDSIVIDFTGQPEGTYFWWEVEAKNEVGTRRNLEGPVRFQITPPPPLGDFRITAPSAGAQIPTAPTIIWTASENATGYSIEIYADQNGSPASVPSAVVNGIAATTYTFPAPPVAPGFYWVQVFARRGAAERRSGNGAVRARFTDLQAFSLISPVTPETLQALQPTLRWQNTQTPGSFSFYRINFYHRGDAQPFATFQSVSSTANLFGTGLAFMPGTYYEWDVDVVAPLEERRSEGGRGTFLTSPVRPFQLVGPLDGAKDVPEVPLFRWNPSPGAISYTVQIVPVIKGVPNFPLQQNSGPLTQLSWTSTLAPFEPFDEFLWRVIATDTVGFAENIGGFQRVRVTPLRDFTLLSPATGATGVSPEEAVLAWEAVPNASGYRVRLALEDGAPLRSTVTSEPFLDFGLGTGPRLNGSTLYRWTVEAIAGGIERPCGETFVFRTGPRSDAFGGDILEALVLRQALSAEERATLGVFGTPETAVVDASAYIRWLLGG
jgi:hypothetical protein